VSFIFITEGYSIHVNKISIPKLLLKVPNVYFLMDQKSHLKKMVIVTSIIVTMIGTVAVAASSIALFSNKAGAATASASSTNSPSAGATSNETKNKPVEGYDSPQGAQ
jgi:hypothetical protein